MDGAWQEGGDMIRRPAVAGSFYPADPTILRRTLQQLLSPLREEKDRVQARGALVPHAAYLYSGKTAGKVNGLLHIPHTVVLLGPNHFRLGPAIATFASGSWETPLGSVRINAHLAQALTAGYPQIIDDPEAHAAEHAIEVQLPFLQYLRPDVTFVPILARQVHALPAVPRPPAPHHRVGTGACAVLARAHPRPTW